MEKSSVSDIALSCGEDEHITSLDIKQHSSCLFGVRLTESQLCRP